MNAVGRASGRSGVAILALLLLSTAAAPAAQSPAPQRGDGSAGLIRAVKQLEAKLGIGRAGTFETESNRSAEDYRCYYTGKLKLPDDYGGLRLKRGTDQGCKLNARKYDVFYYALQAEASPKVSLTTSLAHASPERVLMVIPHEDFHQDPALKGLPDVLTEAAATLVGFLTAREVAREQFGENSDIYRNLSREADLFLNKSRLVDQCFENGRQLYAAYGAKSVSKREVLSRKARYFDDAERQCENNAPKATSFNRCLAANNNAGLAFDHTYTLYYPLMYEVAEANGEDLKSTIDALKLAMAGQSGAQAIENLKLAGRAGSTRARAFEGRK